MTIAEIFGKISAHMVEGMMFHEQMTTYYEFMALDGYACCHRWHYICESMAYSRLHNFYINHFNKLLVDQKVDSGTIIPTAWNGMSRFDVDVNTKKNAVKSGVSSWHKWEKETKDLYLQMHQELSSLGEHEAAHYISKLIKNVEKEIKCAELKMLKLNSVAYDLIYIYEEQDRIMDKYKCHIDKVYKTTEQSD